MSDPERRQSSRTPVAGRCWCEDGEVTLYSSVGNLSEGGLFVRTFAPLPRGRVARVRFSVNDGGRQVEAGATVRWRRDDAAGGLPAGMGLEFTKIESESLDRIRRYLRSSTAQGSST